MALFINVYSFQLFNICTFCVYLLRNNRQPILYQRFPKLRLQGASFKFSNVWQSERDLYKRCLLLYFMLKKQEIDQSQQEYKVYGSGVKTFFLAGQILTLKKPGGPQPASHPRHPLWSVATSYFSLSCGTRDRGGGCKSKIFPSRGWPPPSMKPFFHRQGREETTFFSTARGPQHAARGPQHKCGPRVTRAALRNFAGHITMLLFAPSAGHFS